jgi:hypothetical protein
VSEGRTSITRLSYRDDQPYEVPFRAVEHDEDDDGLEGFDFIMGTGRNEFVEYWGTESDWREERRDILRRDRARKRLGGFGFRA